MKQKILRSIGLAAMMMIFFNSPSFAEGKKMAFPQKPLTEKVTKHEGTEPPFKNEYWDNKAEGVYVDIHDGVPLFSSKDKYDSGTGWPSFTKPLDIKNLEMVEDRKLFGVRTEVRSKASDSHLGHVFDDGPKDKGGLRYCLNSAALHFIPKDKLAEAGYADLAKTFEK